MLEWQLKVRRKLYLEMLTCHCWCTVVSDQTILLVLSSASKSSLSLTAPAWSVFDSMFNVYSHQLLFISFQEETSVHCAFFLLENLDQNFTSFCHAHDIDIAILCICLVPVLYRNGSTYNHTFFLQVGRLWSRRHAVGLTCPYLTRPVQIVSHSSKSIWVV